MAELDKTVIEWWISEEYIWELTVAVKLLLSIDPQTDTTKIELSGNEKPARIYAFAIKKIKQGELTAVDQEMSDTGETKYYILRDDFVCWAYKHYKAWAQPLYSAWKIHKARTKKPRPSQESRERYAGWQKRIDELYLEFHEKNPYAENYHRHRCRELAKELPSRSMDDKTESFAETIRRSTCSRGEAWIMGELGDG